MKKSNFIKIIVVIIYLFMIKSYAQVWKSNLPKDKKPKELVFFDYQKAFNTYWDKYDIKNGYYVNVKGKKTKASGWKLFKRWEYYWENRVNQTTGEFPKTSSVDEYNIWKKNNSTVSSKSIVGDWESLGPSKSAASSSGNNGFSGIGRINCITFHPSTDFNFLNTFWVGTPSGGLWQTTDGGGNWTALTDNNDVLGVSDIAVSSNYENDGTIYIATGDRDTGSMHGLSGGQNNDNNSIGVLKSEDKGLTWNPTGLSYLVSEHKKISRLLIDPINDAILYAAVGKDIYKTIDLGVTWSHIYDHFSSLDVITDMEFMPENSQIIYATLSNGINQRVEIEMSTNGGDTWSTIKTFPNGLRGEIAVTPANPNYLYGIVANDDGGLLEIGRIDFSVSNNWQTTYTGGLNKALLGHYSNGKGENKGQGSYDLAITISPTNANLIFIGGVNTHVSYNGGEDWINSSCWTSDSMYNIPNLPSWPGPPPGLNPVVHADKHMLKFNKIDGILYECNDGGLFSTIDEGYYWTNMSEGCCDGVGSGIVNSQIYRLGVSQTNPTAIIAGLQDSVSKLLSNGNWTDIGNTGDSMECIIDYTDYNIQYKVIKGIIGRTLDAWATWDQFSPDNILSRTDNAWVIPFVMDPINHETLYAGYSDVYKTTDKGNSWNKISTMNSTDKIRSIAISNSDTNYLYVADKTHLWLTTNSGANWVDRTSDLPVDVNAITYITVKDGDPNTVWVTMGGYDSNRVFQTTNGGVHWVNISYELPNIPVMSIVQNKQNINETELYIATDVGVYLKLGNDYWRTFNVGLPNVVVTELEIYYDNLQPENSKLRAATFGRGLWQSDLFGIPSGQMVYDASTVTQTDTSFIQQGDENKKIIGVEIITTGGQNAIEITSLTFNTNGSTNANGDIANAKLFYTNNFPTFEMDNQFGNTVIKPNGTFTIDDNLTLYPGVNYFWLVYDMENTATVGNQVDGECTSVLVDNITETPTITNPNGNREISLCESCYSWGNAEDEISVKRVLFNTIDNLSIKPLNIYAHAFTDYTQLSTEVLQNQSYDLTVNVNTDGDNTVETAVWIDWNHDCVFDYQTEQYDLGIANNVSNGITSNSPLSITVPSNAAIGNTKMRVSTKNVLAAIACQTNYSGEVEDYTIIVKDKCPIENLTIWNNGTWSNGVPDSTKPVVINSAYDASIADISCCSLTINNSASIVINAGEYMLIQNDLINNGTITVKHEGSLVMVNPNGNVLGSGIFQIEKSTTEYVEYDFTYWSSPIENANTSTVFADSRQSRIYEFITENFNDSNGDTYDDNSDDWNVFSGQMNVGKGYIVEGSGSDWPYDPNNISTNLIQNVSFNGSKINNGNIITQVTLDANNGDSFNNQNLIGNPYPSAIDIKKLQSKNNVILSGTYYFWTHGSQIGSQGGNTGPNTYNFSNVDYATATTNGVLFNSVASTGTVSKTAPEFIASGQSFFADVLAAGSVTFTNEMRVTGNNNEFRISNINNKRIWLNMTNELGLFRQTLIGFFEEATDNHDDGIDGLRLESGENYDFYSLNNSIKYAIQGLPLLIGNKTIPLGFEAIEEGRLSIGIDHYEGDFSLINIYLRDNLLGILHDLNMSGYDFENYQTGEFTNRFELLFSSNSLSLSNELVEDSELIIRNLGEDIHVEIREGLIAKVQIFDIIGKLLFQKVVNNSNSNLRTNIANGTVLLIKVQLENGQILTKKMMKY